jgi:hypothetical protein
MRYACFILKSLIWLMGRDAALFQCSSLILSKPDKNSLMNWLR